MPWIIAFRAFIIRNFLLFTDQLPVKKIPGQQQHTQRFFLKLLYMNQITKHPVFFTVFNHIT